MWTTHNRSLIAMVLTMFVFYGFFFLENCKINQEVIKEQKKEEAIKQQILTISKKLDELNIEAKSVSVYDATNQRTVYNKNADSILPLASLTKTMTAIVALENNPNGTISIQKEALDITGDYGLFLDEIWEIVDLVKFTLVLSSNDGAYALSLIDKNFLVKMNLKAKEIGMVNTYFINPTGLDFMNENSKEKTFGAYGTAREANTLAMYALMEYPEIFYTTTLPDISLVSLSGFTHKIQNTNLIINKIPNIMFSKTGFTDLAGGNLTVIFKNESGINLVVTILGSSFEGRFYDMEKIINILYNLNYVE